jgi:hypothetical protein
MLAGRMKMRIAFAGCALLLITAFATPPAEAKDKRSKSMRKLQDINWGRRADITVRFLPVHQHPFPRFF